VGRLERRLRDSLPDNVGRKARGRRTVDLFIAATALSNELPLYTCNPDDFAGLESLLDRVAVPPPADPEEPRRED